MISMCAITAQVKDQQFTDIFLYIRMHLKFLVHKVLNFKLKQEDTSIDMLLSENESLIEYVLWKKQVSIDLRSQCRVCKYTESNVFRQSLIWEHLIIILPLHNLECIIIYLRNIILQVSNLMLRSTTYHKFLTRLIMLKHMIGIKYVII